MVRLVITEDGAEHETVGAEIEIVARLAADQHIVCGENVLKERERGIANIDQLLEEREKSDLGAVFAEDFPVEVDVGHDDGEVGEKEGVHKERGRRRNVVLVRWGIMDGRIKGDKKVGGQMGSVGSPHQLTEEKSGTEQSETCQMTTTRAK